MKNKNSGVQLITYANSLGHNLSDLKHILDHYLKPAIKGVHLLPLFPSSSDRGFAPLTHREINPKFGTSTDLEKLSSDYELMTDLIVNHISSQSKYFQDYLQKGDCSRYANFFIEAQKFSRRWHHKKPKLKFLCFLDSAFEQLTKNMRRLDFIFHKNGINRLSLHKIYRPRPGSPFIKFKLINGANRYLLCTFSADQIDLNIKNVAVKKKFIGDIKYLKQLGISFLRLDAVAYTGKKRGTNNFLIPETIAFIKWLSKQASKENIKIVPEVHSHYKAQLLLAELDEIDYVYDFSLPFLMLNALFTGQGKYLKDWLIIRPANSISNLDTHDGIGVVDVKDLLPKTEITKTSQKIISNGGNATMRATGKNSENVDVYQINCTYFSALAENEQAYIAARAIQLFLPGIPQIYYVGLLVGKNDEDLLRKTNIGRDINRHFYKIKEIKKELRRPVVKKLFKLCKTRNTHLAFQGKYKLKKSPDDIIEILWTHKKDSLLLKINLKNYTTEIIENKKRKIF